MSMLCPMCGEKLACTDSRRQVDGMIKRAYKCARCLIMVHSVEVMTKVKYNKRAKVIEEGKLRRAEGLAKLAVQVLESQGYDV